MEVGLIVGDAGAVAGLTMSSCWIYADWRSSCGKGVGIAVVSRGFGDWEASFGRSMVAIPPLYGMCKGMGVAGSTGDDSCVRGAVS